MVVADDPHPATSQPVAMMTAIDWATGTRAQEQLKWVHGGVDAANRAWPRHRSAQIRARRNRPRSQIRWAVRPAAEPAAPANEAVRASAWRAHARSPPCESWPIPPLYPCLVEPSRPAGFFEQRQGPAAPVPGVFEPMNLPVAGRGAPRQSAQLARRSASTDPPARAAPERRAG